MDLSILGIAFLLGLSSSLHCLGMCGPLVITMHIGRSHNKVIDIIQYFFGKTIAYGSIGLVIGMLGWGMYALEWQQQIAILAGLLLILTAIFPFKHLMGKYNGLNQWITRSYGQVFAKKFYFRNVVLGYLNGLLPCGVVYVALATAVVQPTPWLGALSMIAFGLGTIPILLLIILLNGKLKRFSNFKYITTISTILVGVFMILRGADLHIPYLSPSIEISAQQVSGCCEH